jgi:septal ring factor EnvC (AmiA/AmiB activator)
MPNSSESLSNKITNAWYALAKTARKGVISVDEDRYNQLLREWAALKTHNAALLTMLDDRKAEFRALKRDLDDTARERDRYKENLRRFTDYAYSISHRSGPQQRIVGEELMNFINRINRG